MKIEKTVTVYQENGFYSAFPGIANLGDGKIVVAFRRAPNYQGLPGVPEGYYSHGDALSQFVICFSEDNGENWSKPRLLYSSPVGGSQDGGLFYDGKYLFANSFVWRYLPELPGSYMAAARMEFIFHYLTYLVPFGSYVLRSDDRGATWSDAVFPEPLPENIEVLPGQPLRLHNRGNLVRSKDGRLILSGKSLRTKPARHSTVTLYQSSDNGESFQFLCNAIDAKGIAIFEEPCLYITEQNKWVVLCRSHKLTDGTSSTRAMCVYAYSHDEGKSWSEPVYAGFHAEPITAHCMDDGRVLLAYGYRKEDGQGVRLKVCNPELTDIETAEELILRSDNGHTDCGYPTITSLGNNRYMIAYYMDKPQWHCNSKIEVSIVDFN